MSKGLWDLRFMDLAKLVASWSKDPSTQVGAVIVDDKKRIVSLGYNGFPRGIADTTDRLVDKTTKYAMIVHSEANAILNANVVLEDCHLYTTKFPCSGCTKLIIQSGIQRVYAPKIKQDEVWTADAKFSSDMLVEAGVTLEVFEQRL